MPRDLSKPRVVPAIVKAERAFWLNQLLADPSSEAALGSSIRPPGADKGPGFWKSMLRNKDTGCELHFVYMKSSDGAEFFMAFDPEVTDFTKACAHLEQNILEKRFKDEPPLA